MENPFPVWTRKYLSVLPDELEEELPSPQSLPDASDEGLTVTGACKMLFHDPEPQTPFREYHAP